MNLFILAAGRGTRLMPLTKDRPKSLIDLGNGITLLEHQVKNAISSGIFDEIIIITGYKTEQIEERIKQYHDSIAISTIFNPFYDVSNNLLSLWAAHYRMNEKDFIVSNGDNIYLKNVYNIIMTKKEEVIQITIDKKHEYDDDDMKVMLNGNNRAVRVHKDIPLNETNAESVGLALIKGEKSRRLFSEKILQLAKNPDYINRFWLEIFNSLTEDGTPVETVEISHDDWREVDFHPDLKLLQKILIK